MAGLPDEKYGRPSPIPGSNVPNPLASSQSSTAALPLKPTSGGAGAVGGVRSGSTASAAAAAARKGGAGSALGVGAGPLKGQLSRKETGSGSVPLARSLEQKTAEQKRSKKQKELDSVPEPVIDFMDVKESMAWPLSNPCRHTSHVHHVHADPSLCCGISAYVSVLLLG
jgi:hypothetical protein